MPFPDNAISLSIVRSGLPGIAAQVPAALAAPNPATISDSEILGRQDQNLVRLPAGGTTSNPTGSDSSFEREFSLILETMLRAGILQLRLNSVEAARALGVDSSTLADWRRRGSGPRFEVVSERKFYYLLSDIVRWLSERRRYGNNSEYRLSISSLRCI